LLCFLIYYII